jgi:hypothetical protein
VEKVLHDAVCHLAHCISELNPVFCMGNATRGSEPHFVYATDFDGCFRHLQNLGFQMADKMADVQHFLEAAS